MTPCHALSFSRVKPFFVAWTTSMDSIVPVVFAIGAEFVKWPSDLGLSVTSQLLFFCRNPCAPRARRNVRLWMNLDTPVLDHKMSLSRTIASALIARRSQQLLSRIWRFRILSGFSAVCTFKSDSHMLQPDPSSGFLLELQRLLPHCRERAWGFSKMVS